MAVSRLSGLTARKKHVIFKKENDVLFEWLVSVSAWIGGAPCGSFRHRPPHHRKDSASIPLALMHELPLRPHSPPPSRLPLYFFEKMRYTMKHHLWRCSQALRRGACKPLIPVFNSGHRLQPSHSCMSRSFFLQNGLACDSESIGIRIAIVVVALPFSNETHTLSDRIPPPPASAGCDDVYPGRFPSA